MPLFSVLSAAAVIISTFSIDGMAQAASGSGSSGTAPTVTRVTPNTGPARGGTPSIQITGTNLKSTATTNPPPTIVKFGTATATKVSCTTTTSCTVTSPPGAGRTDVLVTVGSQTSQPVSADRFFYVPEITSINPTSGPAAGGTQVTINGVGLKGGATTVAFGGAAPVAASCNTAATQCTVTSPAGGASTTPVNVIATVDGQASAVTTNAQFTFTGTGNPAVTLTPQQLTFTSQAAGTVSTAQTVAVGNAGTAPLTFTNIVLGGTNAGDFRLNNGCTAPVAPGASCNLNVRFAPTAGGSRTAQISISDNAPGSPHVVSLTGGGGTPQATVSPTALTFSAQQLASTSATQTLTVSSTGGAPIVFNATPVTLAGTVPGDYVIDTSKTTCAGTLNVGQQCTVGVQFKPTASGARNATLRVASNDANSPLRISLSGTGTNSTAATLTSLSATSGPATGIDPATGKPVAITATGTGFSTAVNATKFFFGTVAAPSTTCASTTQCTVAIPAGPIGTPLPVTVSVSGQQGTGSVPFTFTAVTAPANSLTLGAVDPAPGTGLPRSIRDSSGKRLALCIDAASGLCLAFDVPSPNQPISFPDNYPDEAFYWNADATMPVGNGGTAHLILATEMAYTPTVAAGNQTLFDRIRIRITGLQAGATYTITHPYGSFTQAADSSGVINVTRDVGCAGAPCTRVNSGDPLEGFGTWLTWDSGAPATGVGDAATAHTVTGSPIGANVWRVEGPDAAGSGTGNSRKETNKFIIAGKYAAPTAAPRGGNYTSGKTVTLSPSEPGATVRYTTNGSAPSGASTMANGPITLPEGSTTLKFQEFYAGGGSSPVVTETYVVELAAADKPTIDAISPTHGPAYGGTVISITGKNFSSAPNGTLIRFDDDAALSVSCSSTTTCTATSPGGVVTNADNPPAKITATVQNVVSNAVDFTYDEVTNSNTLTPGPLGPDGYPRWFKDSRGQRLELCLDVNSGKCLTTPDVLPDADAAVSFPFNYADENFWWSAEATMPAGAAGSRDALLVLATEAAFVTDGVIADGQQIMFNRIRIRVWGLVPGETYTVTHPYGTKTYTIGSDGRINDTIDVGCLTPVCDFSKPRTSQVGPWLTWDGTVSSDGFMGNPGVEHTVTGSPYGTNYFRIDGKNAGGEGKDRAETKLFAMSGKVAAPVLSLDKPGKHYNKPQQVKLLAEDVDPFTIYYTLDGSTPNLTGTGSTSIYDPASGGVTVDHTLTLTVRAKNSIGGVSDVRTEHYIIGGVPAAKPNGGSYTKAQSVTLTPSIAGDTIYYTLDGSDPTTSSAQYGTALTIDSNTTLKFMEAFADGSSSDIVTEKYIIDTAAPSIKALTPSPGVYHQNAVDVVIVPSESGTIYYTTDGTTTPTQKSTPVPATGLHVTQSTTFLFRAFDDAGNPSSTVKAFYGIDNRQKLVGAPDALTNLFPAWLQDVEGQKLAPCLDLSPLCIVVDLPNPGAPLSFPDNFPDEFFYWKADATMPVGNGGTAGLTLATEATYADGVPGLFNRIRIRASGLQDGATYTITHPYGVETAVAEGGQLSINITDDVGCIDSASCINQFPTGRVGPWLKWDAGEPDGYLGDPTQPHTVTGSPLQTNYFRIEGPGAGVGGNSNSAETNQFELSGKRAQ